jgi:hypothetical protein
VPPMDSRKQRRSGRARRGPAIAPLEALERREVLAYSALGYSLADLVVKAYSAPVATYGGTLAISANVSNLGASSIPEPFHQQPGAVTTANATPSVLDVFASPKPGQKGHEVLIGQIAVPAIEQNDSVNVTGTAFLPARPAGFPKSGPIYLTYVVNPGDPLLENAYNNNAFVSKQPVFIEASLPNLQVVGFETPTPLQPGDVLIPAIRIANLGTANTSDQGPVTVDLVASQNTTFGPGDQILATYTVANVPPLSSAPSTTLNVGDLNLTPGNNVITLSSKVITLPASPHVFYLGVKVNPFGSIKESGKHPAAGFDAIVKVGPPIAGLAPTTFLATTDQTTVGSTPQIDFPFPLAGASSASGIPTVATVTASSGLTLNTQVTAQGLFSLSTIGSATKTKNAGALGRGSTVVTRP